MRGINPDYLAKLDEGQRKTILTGPGKFFADNFLFVEAEHIYIIGPTGSGKTNKNYNLVNFLKATEVILWISASKDNDIAPLFFMGLPVNIIIPKYSDIDITLHGEPIPFTKTFVSNPSDIFYAIKHDHINILEVRRAFSNKDKLLDFMIEFFRILAEWTGSGLMPRIRPDKKQGGKSKITIFIDESQWLIAGSRVTNDPKRAKATEVITENALEVRTYGWRFAISAQGFTNTPPALRDNMACALICNNAEIEEPRRLRIHCKPTVPGWIPSSRFKRNECKFVNRFGVSSPSDRPLPWPLYPKDEKDREKAERMRIVYARRYHDQPPEEAEPQEECFPELGRFSAMAIPPEKAEIPTISRFGQVITDE